MGFLLLLLLLLAPLLLAGHGGVRVDFDQDGAALGQDQLTSLERRGKFFASFTFNCDVIIFPLLKLILLFT